MKKPDKTGDNRNPNGTFKEGISGNLKGRPIGSGGLKDYDRQRFYNMTDKEKEEFLKTVAPDIRYRMAEGNPSSQTDVTSGGDKIVFVPTELIDKHNDNSPSRPINNSEGPPQI